MPPPGQPGRNRHRACVRVGSEVYIVQKQDQRTGRETKGSVVRVLTKSGYHPRGIKVMLAGGVVGRVSTCRFDGDPPPASSGMSTISSEDSVHVPKKKSLSDYLKEEAVDDNLALVLQAAAVACSRVASDLRTLSLSDDGIQEGGTINVQGEQQKGMDVRANDHFLRLLKPVVSAMVSEEEEDVLAGDALAIDAQESQYVIAFDPLDGSSGLDAAAPTGSIFGVYRRSNNLSSPSPLALPPRRCLVAAGYAVYSSATELVLAGVAERVVGFTLDDHGTFRQSRSDIVCPDRGPYYSLNEAREPDWPVGLRRWVDDAKRGRTPAGTAYSARYICSLASDFHRTLLKGGWAGNPRPHLRLLYEAAPLAFIAEAAGGAGSDGVGDLLDVAPANGLHHRVCCFLGSKLDIEDLKTYGNVQQSSKRYES